MTVLQAVKIRQAGAQTTVNLFVTFKKARKRLHYAQSYLALKLIATKNSRISRCQHCFPRQKRRTSCGVAKSQLFSQAKKLTVLVMIKDFNL